MSARITVAVFPTWNREGQELLELLAQRIENMGMEVQAPEEKPVPLDFERACQNADVVILDGSRCPPSEHNYALLSPRPLDHLLIASRTYLPLNVYCLREGIQDPESQKLIYGAPFYPNSQTNQQIVRWVELQLEDLRSQLPRPKLGSLRTLTKGFSQSLHAHNERRRRSGEIFISYRSSDNDAVLTLKERLETGTFHNLGQRTVRYFPPASLSDELATEQRRWQILSGIDRFMGLAAEVWIYESESYYDSWWTLGELLSLAYREVTRNPGKLNQRVKIFKPDTEEVRDAFEDYLPILTSQQKDRRARWFANADTAEMGPESVAVLRLVRHLPLIGRLKYLQDHAWSDLFWRHPILDCPACRTLGENRNRFNVDDILWTRGESFTRLNPMEAAHHIERGEIGCPHCDTVHRIIPGPPQYLWMPAIQGHVMAHYWQAVFGIEPEDPEELHLVALPTHRLRMQWSQDVPDRTGDPTT